MVSALERWLSTVDARPDALAVDDHGVRLTRAELRQRVVDLASDLPVARGSVVALHVDHGADFVVGPLLKEEVELLGTVSGGLATLALTLGSSAEPMATATMPCARSTTRVAFQ